ncbi:MAG: DUF72 domain-containing protein [Candidatus Omnitrophica bacterium]|nr:DUF72 domain-containing protein [Candidatus Omnitrophota bacterium]
MSAKIRIGTSGWHYSDWRERFYPKTLNTKDWFKFYSRYFNTVEINNTFYRLPSKSVFRNWHVQAEKGFLYSIKANRYITHMKKLKDAAKTLKRFFQHVKLLKANLGPILYQLPPGWSLDLVRFRDFLSELPKGYSHVFEFRNNTWFKKEIFDLMAKHNVSFCIHDMLGVDCPRLLTNDIIYLRFHGTEAKYHGRYSISALKKWSIWVKRQRSRRLYVYFNNDVNAHAVSNAQEFKKILAC